VSHGLDNQGLIPHRGKEFSLCHYVQNSSGPNHPCISWVHKPVSPGAKWPKFKRSLKGTHFQSTEDTHKKMTELREVLSQNDRRCLQDWKFHMVQCVASDRN